MISVIVTVYNTSRYLRQCIHSICSQTYTDLEIICINDGSKDDSQEVLEDLAQNDTRIIVIEQENQGPGIARNVGIERAKGEFVCFIDSDDYLAPTYIDDLRLSLLSNSSDIAICRSYEFDDTSQQVFKNIYSIGNRISDDYCDKCFNISNLNDDFYEQYIGWPWDKMYRLDFIKNNNIIFPKLTNTEDLPFVHLAMSLAKKISFVDEYLIYHRINNLSSTSNVVRNKNYDAFLIAFNNLKDNLLSKGVYELCKKPLVNWMMVFLKWHYVTVDKSTKKNLKKVIDELFLSFDIGSLDASYFFGDLDKFITYKAFKESEDSQYKVISSSVFLRRVKTKLKMSIDRIKLGKQNYRIQYSCYTSDFWTVYSSKFFNPKWYKETYLNKDFTDEECCLHYVFVGWRKGFNPSSLFNANLYLLTNEDVKQAGLNPLVHYLKYGVKESREI